MPKKMTNARKLIGSKFSSINSQYFSTDLFAESVDVQNLVFGALSAIEALYENSKPFAEFLKKEGLGAILRKTKLRMRETHRIVPHVSKKSFICPATCNDCLSVFSSFQRLSVPLSAPANTLPEFSDKDAWYCCVSLPLLCKQLDSN